MNRNKLIDFIRGFAVLFVIFGHNIQYTYHSGDIFFNNILFKIIYSFHMPLFALISGYLLWYSMKYDFKSFLKKKVNSLLIPLISWLIFSIVVFYRNIPIINSIKSIIAGYWFIVATLISAFIIYVVEKYIKNDWLYIIFMVLCLFTNFLCVSYVFPYFVIGFLFNKYNLKEKFSSVKRKNLFLISIMLIYAFFMLIYKKGVYIYVTGNDILHSYVRYSIFKQFLIDGYRYFIGLIGSITVILLLYRMYETFNKGLFVKFKELIEKIGKLSFIFYIFEIIVNSQILCHLNWTYPSIIIWFAIFNLKIFIYYIIYRIIKKTPIVNKLLLGF